MKLCAHAAALLWLAGGISSCSGGTGGSPDTGLDGGPDGDADGDGDADSDGDSDTDSETETHPFVPLEWVAVPAGTFTMGSPASEPCRGADAEDLIESVTLTYPFEVARSEVTQEQWMGHSASRTRPGTSASPARCTTSTGTRLPPFAMR